MTERTTEAPVNDKRERIAQVIADAVHGFPGTSLLEYHYAAADAVLAALREGEGERERLRGVWRSTGAWQCPICRAICGEAVEDCDGFEVGHEIVLRPALSERVVVRPRPTDEEFEQIVFAASVLKHDLPHPERFAYCIEHLERYAGRSLTPDTPLPAIRSTPPAPTGTREPDRFAPYCEQCGKPVSRHTPSDPCAPARATGEGFD